MHKSFVVTAVVVVLSGLAVAGPVQRPDRERLRGVDWVTPAPVTAAFDGGAITPHDATVDVAGSRPIVLIETNYYTFLPGERVQVRMTVNPNHYTSPVTMFLYRENRVTAERQYYNIAGNGLMTAGSSADLFGSTAASIPILVPTLNDFVLFGSASDPAALSWGVDGALGGSIGVPAGQTGQYQWVLELRDPAGKRVVARSNAMFSHVEETVNVSGTISSSTTWTANRRYVLNDFVGVAEPAVLTIEPGTVIYGGTSTATLFIRRGAQISANGTARRPIIFTSPQKVGSRAQRDWGSLVLLGRAPVNVPSGEALLEGLPSQPEYRFGGTSPGDSSGSLRYVRLEFGGFEITQNQEINGLTMAGVGNGTTIEYIEVLQNKDDAFEWFGGTVNARYLLGIGFADDGLDWDLGYQGNVQFAVMIKRAINDENDGNILVEGDGNPDNFTLTPKSNPLVFNVTGYGTGRTDVGNYGVVLRRGTAGGIFNAIVVNSRRTAVTIRDDATFANVASAELMIGNSILAGSTADASFGNSADRPQQTRDVVYQAGRRNRNIDPLLAAGAPDHIKTLMPDLTPLPGSPALDIDFVAQPPDNGFFRPVDFIGGVDPGDDWVLSGWATFSDN